MYTSQKCPNVGHVPALYLHVRGEYNAAEAIKPKQRARDDRCTTTVSNFTPCCLQPIMLLRAPRPFTARHKNHSKERKRLCPIGITAQFIYNAICGDLGGYGVIQRKLCP